MKRNHLLLLLTPALLFHTAAANATTLEGNVRQVEVRPAAIMSQAPAIQNQAPTLAQAQVQQRAAASVYQAAAGSAGMRARILQGRWICNTQVTASSAPGVVPGTQVQSLVVYAQNASGQTVEMCAQDGWSPTAAAVVNLTSDTMIVDRFSASHSRGGAIAAQAKDCMTIVSADTIQGTSVVNEYVNGSFIGQYRTQSVLKRAS